MTVYSETWAFLFIDKNIDLQTAHCSLIHSGTCRMLVYGFNNVQEAVETAVRLAREENCTLFELCGGFGRDGAKAIQDAVGNDVMVGYVVPYDPKAEV